MNTDQYIAILHVEVHEEEKGDENNQKGNGGALPETPHFIQVLQQKPHDGVAPAQICK